MQVLISLITLIVMELVLGVDNIIFISILCAKLPPEYQGKARKMGLLLALLLRILLLIGITLIIGFNKPLITLFDIALSVKDFIMLGGGLFLMYKSIEEIHEKMEDADRTMELKTPKVLSLKSAVLQIVLLDLVFSFDSILTAVGMVQDNVTIMIVAVIISMVIMLFFAAVISNFINRHPGIKMLALAFLLMIGVLLLAEGVHFHIPKGYIYFAMGFGFLVEILKIKTRKKRS